MMKMTKEAADEGVVPTKRISTTCIVQGKFPLSVYLAFDHTESLSNPFFDVSASPAMRHDYLIYQYLLQNVMTVSNCAQIVALSS